MKILNEQLVIINPKVYTAEECIRLGGKLLLKKGYIKEPYIQAVVDRERKYPTGLSCEGIAVAIPHADNTYVNKPGMIIMTLAKPLLFGAMGTRDHWLECEIVIMLAIKDSEMQIDMLKELMKIIQSGKMLRKIRDFKDKKNMLDYLQQMERR